MKEGGSFEQSIEYARGKFTGMDCGIYDERGKSLSVIGLNQSVTGVYTLPSAVTGVNQQFLAVQTKQELFLDFLCFSYGGFIRGVG